MSAEQRPAGKRNIATAQPPSGTSPPAKTKKRRILLVDDHPMTREGLAANINPQQDLEVCGEASSPAEGISILSSGLKPDLMVTDLTMPGRSGVEFIKDAHALVPDLAILVLSMHDEMLYAERALRAGARGYLMKDAGTAKVLEVIRLLLSGQSYVSSQISARLLEAARGRRPRGSESPIERLSDREFEVFRLLGEGHSTKEVATALHLSPKTVDVHRSNIKGKLQLRDAASMVHFAARWVGSQETRSS